MRRPDLLALFRVAGYHDDSRQFSRLYAENRIAMGPAKDAWSAGKRMKADGVPCSCPDCLKGKVSIDMRVKNGESS